MTDIPREVTLEIPWRDGAGTARIRRVHVRLGHPLRLDPTGEPRRCLSIVTDGAAESTGLVEAGISWDAVLAQAVMLLDFQSERKPATTDVQPGEASR